VKKDSLKFAFLPLPMTVASPLLLLLPVLLLSFASADHADEVLTLRRAACVKLTAPGGRCNTPAAARAPLSLVAGPVPIARPRFKATPKGPSHNTPKDTPHGYYPADDKMRGDDVASIHPKKPGTPPPPAPDGSFVPDGMCDWCWKDSR